jgi:tetratricopeptide (TPR) repeat protein
MVNDRNTTTSETWSSVQVYTLAAICLVAGIAGGWFIRGSQAPTASAQTAAMAANVAAPDAAPAMPSPEQMKQMADTQVKPTLDRLQSDPNNPGLLTEAGNTYYDAQQYSTAIGFYERTLKVQPSNTSVRTDMATAYWYLGNADKAIEEFNKALSYDPKQANALFNLGIVKWQGKMDIDGAVATWNKLLETNPNYENKQKVMELIAQAQKHTGIPAAASAKPEAR